MSALMTEDYLAARAKRGNRARFEAVLDKVQDGPGPDYIAPPKRRRKKRE
jgi:hypothetical protein